MANLTAPFLSFIDLTRQQELIRSSLKKRIDTVLAHGQYIMGPEVQEFEKCLESFLGGGVHCIGVANGTDALLIALMALGVGPGDEVLTSAFTFAANAEMILLLGAKPVYVDICPQTYNMDPQLIEAQITSRTKAIMPVSLYGQCADLTAIQMIAQRHNLPVIEDAAQSFGAKHQGSYSCSLTQLSCTSFFPSKPLGGYGDGGACFTTDANLAKIMKSIRIHGQEERYHHVRLGLNARLDTLQAAILLAKMEVFENEIALRQQVAQWYAEALQGIANIPYILPNNQSIYAQYTIRVSKRSAFVERMKEQCIPTAIHYPIPAHLQSAYASAQFPLGSLPISEQMAAEVVSLPFHPYLRFEEVQHIALCVKNALAD